MLTSPIKPPLPSPSPSPALSSCSFFPPRMSPQSPCRPPAKPPTTYPRLHRCSSRDSPAATVLSAAPQPILVVFLVLAFIIKKFEKNRILCHRLPAATPAGTPYVTIHDILRGWASVSPFLRLHPCWSELLFFLIVHVLNRMWTFNTEKKFQSVITATSLRLSEQRDESVIVVINDNFRILMPMH